MTTAAAADLTTLVSRIFPAPLGVCVRFLGRERRCRLCLDLPGMKNSRRSYTRFLGCVADVTPSLDHSRYIITIYRIFQKAKHKTLHGAENFEDKVKYIFIFFARNINWRRISLHARVRGRMFLLHKLIRHEKMVRGAFHIRWTFVQWDVGPVGCGRHSPPCCFVTRKVNSSRDGVRKKGGRWD